MKNSLMPLLCPRCHATITPIESSTDDGIICPQCKTPVAQPSATIPSEPPESSAAHPLKVPPTKKNKRIRFDPIIAILLAILCPGAGHLYLNQFTDAYAVALLLGAVVATKLANPQEPFSPFFFAGKIIWAGSILHAMYHAWRLASRNWTYRWFFWRRLPRIRFSLRSLMIFILIFSLPLGWYANERAKYQRLWSWVRDGSCKLNDTEQEPERINSLKRWLGIVRPNVESAIFNNEVLSSSDIKLLCQYKNLRHIAFDMRQKLSDSDIEQLSSLPELYTLRAVSNQISDEGAAKIAKLQNLEWLVLDSDRITDTALEHVSTIPSLTSLILSGKQISDKGIAHLAKLTNLQMLVINETQISSQGLSELQTLKAVNSLHLQGAKIDNDGLQYISSFPKLHTLSIASPLITNNGLKSIDWPPLVASLTLECPGIDDEGLLAISSAVNVKTLKLINMHVTATGLRNLHQMPVLHDLSLERTNLDDDALNEFQSLTKLEALRFREPRITDSRLQKFRSPPSLYVLELRDSAITDQGLKHLETVKLLLILDIGNTKVTDVGLQTVSRFKHLRAIELDGTLVKGAGLIHLQKLKHFNSLKIGGTHFDETQLQHLSNLPPMKYLTLVGPQITGKSLSYISCPIALRNPKPALMFTLQDTNIKTIETDNWYKVNPNALLIHDRKSRS